MTPERFGELAAAYGSDIERWPAAEGAEARAFLRTSPWAQRLLADEAALDGVLASWTVPGPGAAVAGRIIATVASRRARARRLRLWFSGLGTAAALAGGVAAGMGVVNAVAPAQEPGTGHLYEMSVLGAPLDVADPS